MPVTTPWSIFFPDGTSPANLITLFTSAATSIRDALTEVLRQAQTLTSSRVLTAAARDALFPSPVQGNRVYRRDLGFEEVYLELYNATTNPAGANPAGWYPHGGTNIAAFASRSTSQSVVSSGGSTAILLNTLDAPGPGFALSTSRVQVTYPGLYLVTAQLEVAANASGQRNITIGGTGVTRLNRMSNAGAPNAAIAYTGETTAYVRCTAGALLEIQLTQNSGSTLAVNNASMGVTYLGAPKF